MANIWMLAAANIKRSKGQTASLLVFVMIAALLLNMGLVMSLRIGGFFDEQAELSHTAHYTGIYKSGSASIESGRAFMENHPDVTEIETTSAVGGWGKYVINAMEMQGFLIFTPVTGEQKLDSPVTIGDSLPLTGTSTAVYIPNTMMLNGGYSVGDSIVFVLAGKELNFTVAGGTKEIMFGSQTIPFYRIYMSDEEWNELNGVFPENGQTLLSARLLPGKSSSLFRAEYDKAVTSEGLVDGFTYDMAKPGRINFATIASSMLVAFSVMLILVSLIVIRFRIINSIEESMVNIGAQKAIGYRSAQIISSVAMQFGMTALLGGILGVAA
jgi:putative ABC transport system permease protein